MKAFSSSSCCISLCEIYNLSLLVILFTLFLASYLHKRTNSPEQNTTMSHPGLPSTLHGIWTSIHWDQCSGVSRIFFFPLCPNNLEKREEEIFSAAGSHNQIFFSIFWDGRMALLPPLSKSVSLERSGMENSTPDLKSFQAKVLPEESQL